MKLIPVYSTELIQELDQKFPPKCIQPGETLEDANRYAGKRDLIDYLKESLEVAGENQLKAQLNVQGT